MSHCVRFNDFLIFFEELKDGAWYLKAQRIALLMVSQVRGTFRGGI